MKIDNPDLGQQVTNSVGQLDRTIQSNDPITVAPTHQSAGELQWAFDHFNRELFSGKLPPCLLTMQRRRHTYGYFARSQWDDRLGTEIDEIALNPIYFRTRPVEEVLSTVVHEQAHCWQRHFGKAGRGRYHNLQWARKMIDIGLFPSSTGKPGGKITGDRVSHYISIGGPFDVACRKLLGQGFQITWQDVKYRDTESDANDGSDSSVTTAVRDTSKTPFICENGCVRAWARQGARLRCGFCEQPMTPC